MFLSNTLDRLAHELQGFSDDATIRGYLGGLAQHLARMKEICVERGRALHVLVGSDHGSTLLPADASRLRLPQASQEVLDIWESEDDASGTASVSHRAAVVIDPQHLIVERPEDWYMLDKDRYQLGQSYLVPRAYAYLGRRPLGWTHGGLTPEEVIVPLMHFAPQAPQILALTVRLAGALRPRQPTTLMLDIVNPNPSPVDAVVVHIADLVPLPIAQVAAGSSLTVEVPFPARSIEGAVLPIPWSLTGEIVGTPYQQNGVEQLPVRRLQTEDAFDDLFM